MQNLLKTEKFRYCLYGVLFGFLFPAGGTVLECLRLYGSLSLEHILETQKSNSLLWIIDSAPFWLGLFAWFIGDQRDKLNRQSSIKIMDMASFPLENPYPIIRTSLAGTILFSNPSGQQFLKSFGREIGDIVPERLLTSVKELNDSRETKTVEIDDGNRTYAFFLVMIPKRKHINIYASDISERKKIESDLILSKEEAERSSHAKSEFLSRMSHELRTPMNAILGFTQLLTMDTQHPLADYQQESLQKVYSAGNHLLELINEVLDLSQIESGNMKLTIETIDLVPIVDNAISLSIPIAQASGITIEYRETPQCSYFIEADPLRFKQVVLNLISNAIKYNKPYGKVTLSFEPMHGNIIRFGVQDTGPGIQQENIERLFKPFERFDTNADQIEGAGIGLSISKKLIELMNGEIGLTSNSEEGCFFYIDVPLSNKTSLPQQTEGTIISHSSLATQHSRKKLLYIEDIPANVDLVKMILQKRPQVELLSANDAQEGIELAQKIFPDLILMDIHLPKMNGLSAFQKIQTISSIKHCPVIALTADAMDADIKKALEMGFHAYITKPIDVPGFLDKIDRVLESHTVSRNYENA